MSRPGRFLAAALACVALAVLPVRAPATPFADVPANHWAYQAIQSLAADGLIDGYPDGSFKGDRPLTRYEMAAIVARVIAKIEATGAGSASKTDLDQLQKLIDALKDELDALGVRVTSLEDAVASLDRRTRVAQAIAVHGTVLGNGSLSAFPVTPQSILNGTGAAQTPYYAPGPVANGAATGIDQFVNAYASSPDDNNPLEQLSGPQTILRTDARFDFIYTVNENVTVSVPVHVIDYGSASNAQQLSISPDVVVDVTQAGAFTNLTLREAELDNIASSRLGLTYRAPDLTQQNDFENPTQPFPRGFEVGGILDGLTTFQLTFSRVDQTLLNTQSFLAVPGGNGFANSYLAPVVPPQGSLVQTGSAPATDTFTAGANGLAAVYLSKKAVAGTVAITAYATPAGPAAPPAFSYLDSTNEVVFAVPLPPGARVSIGYIGLGYTNNAIPQRYQAGVRINQQFAGVPGAEVGLTFHRLWDENLAQGTTPGAVDLGVNAEPAGDFGAVSDTVFGLDFQVPLAFVRGGDAQTAPMLFGEVSGSSFTPDQQFIAVTGAYAAVAGLKLSLHAVAVTLQYQSIGANYLDGAPLRFFGNAPPTWANYQGDFFPQFFGFANTLGINQTFDASINAGTPGRSATAANPALTFIYPVFNPFVAGGPDYYSAFAPNTQGPSLTVLSPLRLGGLTIDGRIFAQHLGQLQADAGATGTFGPQFPTGVRATFDKLDAGATIPLGHLSVNLSGTLEHLKRNDTLGQLYIPYNPASAGYDPGALASFQAAAGASSVVYYPNYVSLYHTMLAAGVSLPVTHDVVLNTRYSDQRYFGSYGTTLQPNIGGTKDQVDLGLTYSVPKTSSTLGLNFRNSTYKDAALSSYNLTANGEDVNFTIRF
jgi:hypothetical protein